MNVVDSCNGGDGHTTADKETGRNGMSIANHTVLVTTDGDHHSTKTAAVCASNGPTITETPDSEEGPRWNELTPAERIKKIAVSSGKVIALLLLLYFFICSLDFLSTAFRLIAGKAAGEIFQNELLENPVVGVMIGVLATVILQSSSTATSVVVSMVSAGSLTVEQGIPIIMGSNIGTSVTNTIVSLTQVADRDEFERAFAGATVHDMFNWLSVITLLIIEVTTSYLKVLTDAILESTDFQNATGGDVKLLSVITSPFTDRIIRIDKKVLEGWATQNNSTKYENASLVLHCSYESDLVTDAAENYTVDLNETATKQIRNENCDFLFSGLSDIGDLYVGLILLALSLIMLSGCLILMVKILHSVLKGQMAKVIQKTVNADIPYVPCLTGYLAILVGCVMTILVQSSSVFTSAITPLVGIGVISIERAYPLTLGSNIGTTTTAILASLTAPKSKLKASIQIALCHFFFNITGILMFYPVPFTRVPIVLAKILGATTAKYRWFAVAYLIMMFFLLPLVIFALSLAGLVVLYCVLGPVGIITVFVVVTNVLQSKRPDVLPEKLRTWEWLPMPLRSLEPMDRVVTRMISCCKRGPSSPSRETLPLRSMFPSGSLSTFGLDNPSFQGATKV